MSMARIARRLRLTGIPALAAMLAVGLAPLGVEAGLSAPVGIDDTSPTTRCPGTNPYCFLPITVTIDAGGTVTWTSNSSNSHTVTADDSSWGSGNLTHGQTYQHTFANPGQYTYHCAYHSFMTGTVRVNSTSTTSSSSSTTTAPPPTTSSHTTTMSTSSHAMTATTMTTSSAATTNPPPTTSSAAATSSSPAPVAAAGTPASSTPSDSSTASGGVAGLAGRGQAPSTGSGSGSAGVVIAIVVVVVAAVAGGGLWWRRRSTA